MTTTRPGTSRASSARSASVARAITKRREKPYKTERSRVLAKKKKLNLHTTYTKPPAGFQFLPVGTPDLAERCKELSRQRGLPVNVVNAKPVSKSAVDPAKISHHIHRIGYHFRSDVVDDACQQLGYAYSHGKFIKERDLKEQNDQSKLALAMARHGIKPMQPLKQETDEQVRAAIKELFPRIPEDDLKEILVRAWEEGSKRIGTRSDVELPRRVQLATIARIRHTYTDYDRLLRAFEWKDARTLVEPVCLAKLIEWRGENDEDDDNELEEIVRETIVIDDDDDDGDDDDDTPQHDSEADDGDSIVDGGYISDTSVEISHQPAGDADFGAESNDERSRQFLNRYQPTFRTNQRYDEIREKIGVVQQHRRNGIALEYARQPYAGPQQTGSSLNGPKEVVNSPREVVRVHVPETGNGVVEINGQLYRREFAPVDMPRTQSQPLATQRAVGAYGDHHGNSPQSRTNQPYSRPANSADVLHERPIASIEPHDDLRRMAITSSTTQQAEPHRSMGHPRPVTPNVNHSGKRRRVDHFGMTDDNHYHTHQSPSASLSSRPGIPHGVAGQAVDLTSTHWPVVPHNGANNVVDLTNSPSRGGPTIPFDLIPSAAALHGRPSTTQFVSGRPYDRANETNRVHPAYGSQKPLLPANHRSTNTIPETPRYEQGERRGFVDAQVAPIQYVPLPLHSDNAMHTRPGVTYQSGSIRNARHQQATIIYGQQQRPSQTPQPVHGAPAAVQQVSREPAHPSLVSRTHPAPGVVSVTSGVQIPPFPGYAPPLQPLPQPQYYQSR